MRLGSVTAAVVLALLAVAGFAQPASAAVPAWTTYRHDAARSGIDPDSTSPLTPSQDWQTLALDGEVYAQPLLYGSSVYVATENDTIYALNAASGALEWSRHLATPEPSSVAPCGDISPSIGITSTPVIDPATNRIYAVGAVSNGTTAASVQHELFALDLTTGQLAQAPIAVDPSFPNGGAPVEALQRAGLALDNGRILIGYGGNDGDCPTYWGWLVSAPENGTGGLSSFQTDADSYEGAVWGSGNAPPVDSSGNVFLATGNGDSSQADGPDYGDSIVKLNDAAQVEDWWAPPNWHTLDSSDLDLGSSMPALLPGGYLFEAGKDGNGYVVNGSSMGHVANPAAQADGFCAGGSFGGAVYDPANATIYATCAGLAALSFSAGPSPTVAPKPGFLASGDASGPPMIAGGLVWVTSDKSGTLYGIDPETGATSSRFSIPESGSQVNHFASPSAGGGRLFVASGDQVTAFTVANPPPPSSTTTALSASANPATVAATISLTATVSPAPDAGTVSFTSDGAPVSGCTSIPVSVASGGRAGCRTAFAKKGHYDLRAVYSGDSYYTGSASAILSESVTTALVVSHVRLSPHRFRAAREPKLTLIASEAARLTVALTEPRHGHTSGRSCSLKKRSGKRCTVRIVVKRLRFRTHSGRNAFRLKLRGLPPGRYIAVIFATDSAGRRSRTIRISFTVLRTRRAG